MSIDIKTSVRDATSKLASHATSYSYFKVVILFEKVVSFTKITRLKK